MVIWPSQAELSKELHPKIPVMHRHLVSCVTARLLVVTGKSEALPSKETRWLLDVCTDDDYRWLQHGCQWFYRAVVEDCIGQAILPLPLEDQHATLLTWLSRFLKSGLLEMGSPTCRGRSRSGGGGPSSGRMLSSSL